MISGIERERGEIVASPNEYVYYEEEEEACGSWWWLAGWVVILCEKIVPRRILGEGEK